LCADVARAVFDHFKGKPDANAEKSADAKAKGER
jgi:hypothetical protein